MKKKAFRAANDTEAGMANEGMRVLASRFIKFCWWCIIVMWAPTVRKSNDLNIA